MSERGYLGKFNIVANLTYGNKIYSIQEGIGFAPPPPPMECYFILQEDGNFIYQEDLTYFIEQECNVLPVNCYFILQEDGYDIYQEDLTYFIESECGADPAMISFNLTLTGPWAANHTVVAQYLLISNIVQLFIPGVSVATTSSNLITSTTSLPALIVPGQTASMSGVSVINDTTSVDGAATITTGTGILTIGLNIVGGGEVTELNVFENAGDAGFGNIVLTYSL